MAMTILAERCANCGLCAEVCPLSAIRRPTRENGLMAHEIDPERCTECVGHYAWPQCVAHCRLEAIVLDRERFESRTMLLRKWRRITGGKEYAQEAPSRPEPVEEFGGSDA